MIFAPDMLPLVLAGTKTVTRRPANTRACRYRVGHTYAVQPGRGQRAVARIRVIAVERKPVLALLDDAELAREGFASMLEFRHRWIVMHGSAYGDLWRIEFEVAS